MAISWAFNQKGSWIREKWIPWQSIIVEDIKLWLYAIIFVVPLDISRSSYVVSVTSNVYHSSPLDSFCKIICKIDFKPLDGKEASKPIGFQAPWTVPLYSSISFSSPAVLPNSFDYNCGHFDLSCEEGHALLMELLDCLLGEKRETAIEGHLFILKHYHNLISFKAHPKFIYLFTFLVVGWLALLSYINSISLSCWSSLTFKDENHSLNTFQNKWTRMEGLRRITWPSSFHNPGFTIEKVIISPHLSIIIIQDASGHAYLPELLLPCCYT